jgi:hypothetical protein
MSKWNSVSSTQKGILDCWVPCFSLALPLQIVLKRKEDLALISASKGKVLLSLNVIKYFPTNTESSSSELRGLNLAF